MSPTIVVVPGAHHVPRHFQRVTDILEAQNYKVVAVTLPIPGDGRPEGPDGNVLAIREAVQTEVNQGNDVLLVIHSASGSTGPAAIEGLTKTATKPGVSRILAISAILTPNGQNVIDVLKGRTAEWQHVVDGALVPLPFDTPGDEPQALGRPRCSPVKALYNDMTEADQREAYELMTPIYIDAMSKPWTYAAWMDIPMTYIYCKKDKAILLELQEELVRNTGVKVDTRALDASHSPFYSKPQELAELIIEAMGMA